LNQKDFKALFDKHFDALRNFVYYRCGDAEMATDVVQDVFIKIWEKQLDKKPEEVIGLLYKMAKDNLISQIRHQKVERDYEEAPHYHTGSLSPEEELESKELRLKYERALGEMAEKQREVFLMSRNDELKYHEIADRLQISVKAVEKRMKYALEFLRKYLLILCLILVQIIESI
jgi:RNA polymerase sigma-70 factor (family 1)